jgi:hypothetical protein
MTKPQSLSYVEAGNSSFHGHTLLTPPLSPASSEDVPFKPADDDLTSLSMKRRHYVPHSRERRRLNRACASSTELRGSSITYDDLPTAVLPHSKSLSHLAADRAWLLRMLRSASISRRGSDHPNIRGRRWTLLFKSEPAKELADKTSAEIRPPVTESAFPDSPSPAMITLRRASITRPVNRKTSLTFFPPPKFESSTSGLVRAFLRTLTGQEHAAPTFESRRQSIFNIRSPPALPVDETVPEQSWKASAKPVFTKVSGMAPELLQPTNTTRDNAETRRCSTTYISGGSVYEVIWDENISDSSRGSTSTQPTTAPDDRRRSVAMDSLETQLFRAAAQSRRASGDSGASNGKISRAESFSSMLASRFNWSSERLSFSFPSAGRGKKGSLPIDTVPEDEQLPHQESRQGSVATVDFFPPLRSRKPPNVDDSIQQPDSSADLSRRDTLSSVDV